MGVNTRIYLPQYISPDDIGKAISILAGNMPLRSFFDDGKNDLERGWSCKSTNGNFKYTVPSENLDITTGLGGKGYAHVQIGGHDIDSPTFVFKNVLDENRQVMLFLSNGRKGERLMIPSASTYWIAMGKRLVKIFGGRMSYSDYDDKIDFKVTKPLITYWCYEDGNDGFMHRQNIMFNLKPLTSKEYLSVNELAAYPMRPDGEQAEFYHKLLGITDASHKIYKENFDCGLSGIEKYKQEMERLRLEFVIPEAKNNNKIIKI